ncbi:hypothetical protein SU69_08880 [Thermosipho melanesiensis]|uniref:Uncharacterized protein n=2 Tax=Thermosipho melanesiensis TaxID=46541 RepID=A6LNU5_THEM4|nr:hypothetical protein [Thermosipho melanesiensis]ABR31596.1 hypothetical protein Tmel_1757 [Thermosipho melanesiensis BI429]OOC35332.1 hypothetical protein SU69_08880 [Thermosipho melanesiensis]OOC35550.1 hypothetical protein SU70_08890 [Thermosipho melanesiensis]OOC36587.1 hypothetical protein SU68_08945 [Thermosipho melanesiensis]OOC40259.1 hypothetical protein SU71_08875 [Thermosipho melanesiensis]
MFFKRKKNIEKNPFYNDKNALVIYFKCENCGEVFRSHLRKGYDFLVEYDSASVAYKIDKVYVGSKCPNKIEVRAQFTGSYKPVSFGISGGKFISKEDFEKEVER